MSIQNGSASDNDMDNFIGVSCSDFQNTTNISHICDYVPLEYVNTRAYVFAPLGTLICSFGIVGNLILLIVLSKPVLKNTYLIYYLALTFIDIGILVTVYVVWILHILHDYFVNIRLYRLWLFCLPYFYPLSRLFTFTSCYLIVACTFERYFEAVQLYNNKTVVRMTQTKRYVVIASVTVLCFLLRITSIWEVHLVKQEECLDNVWMEYALDQTEMAKNPRYQRITFWFYNVVQVMIPFILLLILNVMITGMWFKLDSGMSQSSKSARRMMFATVTCYLIFNSLNFVITVWEVVDKENLRAFYTEFYSYSVDAVFCSTALNSALRLPVYYTCNHKIRRELKSILKHFAYRNKNTVENNNGVVISTSEHVALVASTMPNGGEKALGPVSV